MAQAAAAAIALGVDPLVQPEFLGPPLLVSVPPGLMVRPIFRPPPDSSIRSGSGSDVRSNRDTYVRSGSGSDVRSNRDSNVHSSSGSDVRSNHDSNVRSGSGSDVRSNRDSNVRSGSGSDVRSNRDSDVRSGSGSDVRSGSGSGSGRQQHEQQNVCSAQGPRGHRGSRSKPRPPPALAPCRRKPRAPHASCPQSVAILHANNARDIELDARAEATTLAQLIGPAGCRRAPAPLFL
eukprot:SAG11_NODE_7886_length_1084_cov_2.018274_1_plen_235_part_00